MPLFAPKGLRAEVTEGIDLEQGVALTGEKITIGSSPEDNLCLGAADIAPAHLTLQRRADGKGWEYFASDRGQTLVDQGNPRTGPVRAGMWIRLGSETRIEIQRATLPATAPDDGPAEKTTVPLPIALGIIGIMMIGFGFAAGLFGAPEEDDDWLYTSAWFSGAVPLDPSLDECLDQQRTPTQPIAADAPEAAYWAYMIAGDRDGETAIAARTDMISAIRGIIADTHLLQREGRPLEASAALRRIAYVLPVTAADCPILAAVEADRARLSQFAE